MYDEILRAHQERAATDGTQEPAPVQELPDVVRLPAYSDGHMTWQGGTLLARRINARDTVDVIVRFDDGRVMMAPDPAAAYALFQANADVWM